MTQSQPPQQPQQPDNATHNSHDRPPNSQPQPSRWADSWSKFWNWLLARLEKLDLSEERWRRRALRYLSIYLVLVVALVTVRYLTHTIRPNLRAAQKQATELTMKRDRLQIQIQALTMPQRIQTWASQNNMQRFAEVAKIPRDLKDTAIAQPTLPTLEPSFTLETKWKDQ